MKHVKLNLELTEWEADGETRARHITIEGSGGLDTKPWTRLQHTGEALTADEIEGLNQVIAGFARMAKEEK